MDSFGAVVHEVQGVGVALETATVVAERGHTLLGIAAHQHRALRTVSRMEGFAKQERLVVFLPPERGQGVGLRDVALEGLKLVQQVCGHVLSCIFVVALGEFVTGQGPQHVGWRCH